MYFFMLLESSTLQLRKDGNREKWRWKDQKTSFKANLVQASVKSIETVSKYSFKVENYYYLSKSLIEKVLNLIVNKCLKNDFLTSLTSNTRGGINFTPFILSLCKKTIFSLWIIVVHSSLSSIAGRLPDGVGVPATTYDYLRPSQFAYTSLTL